MNYEKYSSSASAKIRRILSAACYSSMTNSAFRYDLSKTDDTILQLQCDDHTAVPPIEIYVV